MNITFQLVSAFMIGATVNALAVIAFTAFQDIKNRKRQNRPDYRPKFARMSYHAKH